MKQVQVTFEHNQISVYLNNQSLGTIDLSENPFHSQNIYLTFHLTRYDKSLAAPLFQAIRTHINRPLQVMITSIDHTLTAFLKAGGFERKRICYEMTVTPQDYIETPEPAQFHIIERPGTVYDTCCQLLLNHYTKTHKAISPFTGSEDDFFKTLPSIVYYQSDSHGIKSLAFIEDNEIAYIWGETEKHLYSFIKQIVPYLFRQSPDIIFEADDVDPCAMRLKSVFNDQSTEHWDTYILQ